MQIFSAYKILLIQSRVLETLKDYTVKALVNTVDHLGSVSYKVNDLLQEKIGEACVADLQISCIEQVHYTIQITSFYIFNCYKLINHLFDICALKRMRTCVIYMNHEGRAQQSSALSSPKYHKRYTLPGNFIFAWT